MIVLTKKAGVYWAKERLTFFIQLWQSFCNLFCTQDNDQTWVRWKKMDDRRNNNAVVQQLGMTHGTYFIQFVPLGSPLGSASELGSLGFCHFGPGQKGKWVNHASEIIIRDRAPPFIPARSPQAMWPTSIVPPALRKYDWNSSCGLMFCGSGNVIMTGVASKTLMCILHWWSHLGPLLL